MGQNSDIHNIFESYSNKVLIREQMLQADTLQALKNRVAEIKDPEQRRALEAQIENKGRFKKGSDSAASSTVAKPVEVDGPQPAGTPAPQNNAGGISVGGLTLPPLKQPTASAPTQPTITAQMPATQSSSQGNTGFDVKIPASLGGGGAGVRDDENSLQFGNINIGNPKAAEAEQGNTGVDVKIPASLGGKETETISVPAAGSNKKQSSPNNGSIVDYLAGKNQKFDKASRGKLAAQYGIQNYTGTAQQNTDLLNKLRANEKMPQGTNATGEKQYAAGTVPKASANDSQQQPQQQPQGMGGLVGLGSKALGGAGNLAKKTLVGDQPLGGVVGLGSKALGSVGNMFKKALIGGGQQQATATTQLASPVQQTTSTKKRAANLVKKAAPSQQTASNYNKTPGDASEFFKDQSDEEIQENKNIAKFVKCLSEKNYSQAHEYLKKIVNSKVEKNLYKVINKL